MTQEEKELLLKDLLARLLYGVKVAISHFDEDGNLKRISEPTIVDGYYDEKFTGPKCYGFGIYEIKPYLRPLSSMTEEEKEEFHKLKQFSVTVVTPNGVSLLKPTYIVDLEEDGDGLNHLYDWLNEHHFDYRGLIEKGLALESPEGMYNIKKK